MSVASSARTAPGGDIVEAVEEWVEANWDETITVREWWRRLADAGYAHPTWPVGLGGMGGSARAARSIRDALARAGVIGPPHGGVAASMTAPTLLDHGTPAQIERFVREIAYGEAAWCQLFSEPGSGSDLASVATRAVLDGDEWVVSGQKVWNSGADLADYGMLIARTDWDAPKHHGITYFLIDMHQPGVEARPLKTMSGSSEFCEVFLTEARIPVDRVVGDVGEGWKIAQTTLRHERGGTARSGVAGLLPARSGEAGDLDLPVADVVRRARSAMERRGPLRGGAVPAKAMIELARQHRLVDDPVVRQELARYFTTTRVNAWTLQRSAAAGGRLTGADGSIAKLTTSRVCQVSRDLSLQIVGAAGMLTGPESPMSGELQAINLYSPGARLGGGTDEIQANVLAERGLGLPRESGGDAAVPYRELRVGTQRGADV